MPHVALKDRLNYASWITGVPGCGFNTLGEKLESFMLDEIGYRSTHLKPKEWISCVPRIRYLITDPERDNLFYHGYAQNYREMAMLPWRTIIFLHCPDDILFERVVSFRKDNEIDDGLSDESVVRSLVREQRYMIDFFESKRQLFYRAGISLRIIDASPSVDRLVDTVIKLINNPQPKVSKFRKRNERNRDDPNTCQVPILLKRWFKA